MKEVKHVVRSGPDKGRTFFIQRMSAFEAEKWGRLFLRGATVDISPDMKPVYVGGMAELASSGLGMNTLRAMPSEYSDQLINGLNGTIELLAVDGVTRLSAACIGEEIEAGTYIDVQQRAFELNIGFFQAVSRSLPKLPKAEAERETTLSAPTSHQPLQP
ncbi:hypothetical protein NKW53_03365 [Acetobacter orientalis]|uniref:hypothetical protein n=1 Tax=Acetobacter orientalis TaxID=146474 RepID=UPI0020A1351E|nr:hypothetical protein [Acetobacter orientalis]MCP1215111.1 hypothetical protein [Acetobacter orientalis]MCP1218694.1 hypothetical protein [Acetobacter orientalis]